MEPASLYPGTLHQVVQPQPMAPPTLLPIYRLEVGGGQSGVLMFLGHHHGEVVA
jgi:hypothetical protein